MTTTADGPGRGKAIMIRVQQEPFDIANELTQLRAGNVNIGGTACFVGSVRELSDGKAISTMTLEHYPGMTERALEEIEAEALSRWPLDAALIVHRYGRLEPGDDIVLVITASAHRQAAFDACQFLMDWLKTKAPFWKCESDAQGEQWVAARARDDDAADKWEQSDAG